LRIELEPQEARQDHFLDMTINGKSPTELTEIALRTILFGEPNPFADQPMGFATEILDPSPRSGPIRFQKKSFARSRDYC